MVKDFAVGRWYVLQTAADRVVRAELVRIDSGDGVSTLIFTDAQGNVMPLRDSPGVRRAIAEASE